MNLEALSTKWFMLYYTAVGLCLIGSGLYLVLRNHQMTHFLKDAADSKRPPKVFIRILKYFLFFTLPGLVLSFIPFSWIELLFTLWSLLLVYIAGIQLVRWKDNRALIKANTDQLPHLIRRCGAIMVAVGFAIFLLTFLVISKNPL